MSFRTRRDRIEEAVAHVAEESRRILSRSAAAEG